MKKILISLLLSTCLFSTQSYAVDRAHAKALTEILQNTLAATNSVTPNKAMAYLSDRDDVDNSSIVQNLAFTYNSTSATFTRGESLALTNCSGDKGLVSVTATTIVMATTSAPPFRVLCSDAGGKHRVAYKSMQN